MNKGKLWIPVLAGLMIGQLFAESERPFKVINTVRVGYNDNRYPGSATTEGSSFVTDIVDLSFRAALSDRTDVMVKSQFNLLTDSGDTQFYPNLYVMLSHSVSPRLLLRLSEYYRSGEKTGSGTTNQNSNTQYNYFYNKLDASADYVLTKKDRLQGSLSHEMLRNDKEIDSLDYTTIGGAVSWKRDLIPQRTYSTLNLRQSRTTYDNRPPDTTTTSDAYHTNTVTYLGKNAFYDATELTAGLNHTFNQEWQGHIEAGATYVQRTFSGSTSTTYSNTPVSITTNKGNNATTLDPLFNAGLVYSPSPRTRLTGDLSLKYQASDNDGYGGQNTAELAFGAQHDITAKLMVKATARFAKVAYDTQDSTTGSQTGQTEDRMDLELRFAYKLNRMNFLELGLRHSESEYSNSQYGSWEQNVVDVGWRVELN
ncbi:MAG: outer membrane beta-barrel protein [Kiritimatiellales bacterium]